MIRKLAIAIVLAGPVSAQSFSCNIGDRAACLGFGDKVCSQFGKCVDESAACFDQYQCNYEGFTCKSNVTECVEEYDSLQSRYNILVDDYNDLSERAKALSDVYQQANGLAASLSDDYLRAVSRLEELESCVLFADDVQDAQNCF